MSNGAFESSRKLKASSANSYLSVALTSCYRLTGKSVAVSERAERGF